MHPLLHSLLTAATPPASPNQPKQAAAKSCLPTKPPNPHPLSKSPSWNNSLTAQAPSCSPFTAPTTARSSTPAVATRSQG